MKTTQAETAGINVKSSQYHSVANEPESNFLTDLKKELGLRSDTAGRGIAEPVDQGTNAHMRNNFV